MATIEEIKAVFDAYNAWRDGEFLDENDEPEYEHEEYSGKSMELGIVHTNFWFDKAYEIQISLIVPEMRIVYDCFCFEDSVGIDVPDDDYSGDIEALIDRINEGGFDIWYAKAEKAAQIYEASL